MSLDAEFRDELADKVYQALCPEVLSHGAMLEVIGEVVRRIGEKSDAQTLHVGKRMARLALRRDT